MFTNSCFIRKNTPELRKKLEDIGYKCRGNNIDKYPHLETFVDVVTSIDSNGNYIFGTYSCCNNGEKGEVIDNIPLSIFIEGIDCGEDENLFLAIASLRDDTDKNQIMVKEVRAGYGIGGQVVGLEPARIQLLYRKSKVDKVKDSHFRKATVDEIIEYYGKVSKDSENYIKY
jgi:hypothetical protein